MSADALRTHEALLPPAPGGFGPGAALALAAHAALVAALALGVQWRASAPEVMSAELWSAVPQVAAPPAPPEPAPAPPAEPPAPAPAPVQRTPAPEPDAQIALERAKAEKQRERDREREARREQAQREREKAARDKQEREQREKAQRDREQKAAEARTAAELERRREENLRRMLGQAGSGAPTATGTAAADAAPSKAYAGKLVAAIKPNIVFTGSRVEGPPAEVEVRATATGAILARRLIKSSGNREWDEAVLRAIDRTERLPADTDGRVPSTLVIAFRPQ